MCPTPTPIGAWLSVGAWQRDEFARAFSSPPFHHHHKPSRFCLLCAVGDSAEVTSLFCHIRLRWISLDVENLREGLSLTRSDVSLVARFTFLEWSIWDGPNQCSAWECAKQYQFDCPLVCHILSIRCASCQHLKQMTPVLVQFGTLLCRCNRRLCIG